MRYNVVVNLNKDINSNVKNEVQFQVRWLSKGNYPSEGKWTWTTIQAKEMWYLDATHLLRYLKESETPDKAAWEVTEQIRLRVMEGCYEPP